MTTTCDPVFDKHVFDDNVFETCCIDVFDANVFDGNVFETCGGQRKHPGGGHDHHHHHHHHPHHPKKRPRKKHLVTIGDREVLFSDAAEALEALNRQIEAQDAAKAVVKEPAKPKRAKKAVAAKAEVLAKAPEPISQKDYELMAALAEEAARQQDDEDALFILMQ